MGETSKCTKLPVINKSWGYNVQHGAYSYHTSHGFPRGLAGNFVFLSSCDVNLRVPLVLPQGSQV